MANKDLRIQFIYLFILGTAPALPKTHLNGVLAASRVLLRYLLNSLDALNASGAATSCSLTQVIVAVTNVEEWS